MVVEKPVTPEPCRPGAPPEMPDVAFFGLVAPGPDGTEGQFAATTVQELSLLAAWVVAQAEWRDRVAACPFVQLTNGDIREAMGVNAD